MAIANAASTIEKVVEFINGGQTMLTAYRPDSHEFTPYAPVLFALADGDTLSWQSGSELPTAEKVQDVEQRDDGSFRVVLDSRYPLELRLSRATTPHHKAACEATKKDLSEAHPLQRDVLERVQKRAAWPVRENGFYFSRWFQGDKLVGVAVIGAAGIEFVAADPLDTTMMDSVKEHYGPYDWYENLDSGMGLLRDLHENPTIGRDVSAPEFIRATDLEDAAELARSRAVGELRRAREQE